ncbi:hypothetical protein [Kordiimonas sp.]|uniref:hypothetical protein n=1 Tax=Kordiimonas sp. TaxID=1970157 RepID=UPI003A9534E5
MRIWIRHLALSLALLIAAPLAHADDSTADRRHIFATDWGLTLKSDGTGFYNDLAQLLFSTEMGAIDYEILPYRRAKRHFFEEYGACLYPSSIDYLTSTGDITDTETFIGSRSVLSNKIHIFSRHGTTPPENYAGLKGKRIAYAMGSRIPFALEGTNAFFIAVADEVDKAEMLLTGRVDMISAAMPDVKFVFDSLGVPLAPFDETLVVAGSGIGLVCHNTAANAAFLTSFEARLDGLLKSGELQVFLRNQGLDPDDYLRKTDPR